MEERPRNEWSPEEMERITQYLHGDWSIAEREAFEARMKREPELRHKVAAVKALIIGIREASLAEQLEGFQERISPGEAGRSHPRTSRFYRQWWVAAAAAILVSLGVWQVWFASPSHVRLYRAYFVADAGLPVEMGSADTFRYAFYDGMISYKEGNYADALAKWEAVATVGGVNDTLQYFTGLAYMGLDDVGNALAPLATVASERRSAFYEEATWYLALCYLHLDDRKAAISLLRRIAQDEQAEALLKKLE